jgi:exopolysaccharide biosynthesis polyprenyl glycosylphosphotransferase
MSATFPRPELAPVTTMADAGVLEIEDRRSVGGHVRRRGWLVRRSLVVADLVGLTLAFLATELLFGAGRGVANSAGTLAEELLFVISLPGWVLLAKLYGLYDRDVERTHHTTTDDLAGVFNLTTVGTWLFYAGTRASGVAHPELPKVIVLWGATIAFVTGARATARAWASRQDAYLQNTVIVGAGDIGQRIARKLLRHPEYGLNLIGFVDSEPRPRQVGLEHVALLGTTEMLPDLVRALGVERVVIAFSNDSPEDTLALVRSLNDTGAQVDIVPRLFELISPKVQVDTLEGLPLVELPPPRMSSSSFLIKRTIDIVGALAGLILTAPLFAYFAWRIRRDSPGPVFFRQTRLGLNMREFTALKFRTMAFGADTSAHRDYIRHTMDPRVAPTTNGLYKLEREDAITRVGRRLRRTSLDELPQLLNVLRGDMSLVGPRPCLPYETEHFQPHHYDRFLVPAGITGLWQITARAHSTFGEALDMDVAYARGWSLGLDLRLLCKTPLQLLSRKATR